MECAHGCCARLSTFHGNSTWQMKNFTARYPLQCTSYENGALLPVWGSAGKTSSLVGGYSWKDAQRKPTAWRTSSSCWANIVLWDGWRTSTDDEESGRLGKSIAYNFKLRVTEKSSQMDGWMETETVDVYLLNSRRCTSMASTDPTAESRSVKAPLRYAMDGMGWTWLSACNTERMYAISL